jgi:hypothetical protein
MSQDLIEQIGAKQTSDLVDSLMTEGLLTTSVRDERPQDGPQQLLIQPDAVDGGEVQCTSPTHAGGTPTVFSVHDKPAISDDDPIMLSDSGILDSPDPSLKMNGPMHVSFPVAAGAKRMNVELDVQPSDVTVTYIDKKPSFVLNLSEGVRNQLSQAMDALSNKPEAIPTITFGDGASGGDPMASSGDSLSQSGKSAVASPGATGLSM